MACLQDMTYSTYTENYYLELPLQNIALGADDNVFFADSCWFSGNNHRAILYISATSITASKRVLPTTI